MDNTHTVGDWADALATQFLAARRAKHLDFRMEAANDDPPSDPPASTDPPKEDPPAGDQPADPPASQDPPAGDPPKEDPPANEASKTQADIDKAVGAVRARFSDYDDIKTELAKYKDGTHEQLTQAVNDARAEERKTWLPRLHAEAVKSAAAAARFRDPSDALAAVPLGDDATDVDVEAITTAVAQFAQSKPYLIDDGEAPPSWSKLGGGQQYQQTPQNGSPTENIAAEIDAANK